MTDETNNQDKTSGEDGPALRVRTFLKGVLYYDNRSVSIDCTIRDLSDTGARIAFSTLVSRP